MKKNIYGFLLTQLDHDLKLTSTLISDAFPVRTISVIAAANHQNASLTLRFLDN
jgi:hypothetical protein